jgi:XTP/dITP diphosphohydrolase
MSKMTRLVLASSNRGKIDELRELLAPAGYALVAQSDLGVDDAEETGSTFIENALLKARHAARIAGLPALADDSGLVVDALGGAPGLRSARYAGEHGNDAANNDLLLERMRDLASSARTAHFSRAAHFYCVLVMLRSVGDPQPVIAEGVWRGRILDTPRGLHGFGYDPLFLPDGYTLSSAELDPATKNRISHRGQALTALRAKLAQS